MRNYLAMKTPQTATRDTVCRRRNGVVGCRALVALGMLWAAIGSHVAIAEDVSSPAILQMFEAKWNTIADRQVDLFYSGYGSMWLPPPNRADSSNFSVGYDLFDRFDLGGPRNETLYGTEAGLKSLIQTAHKASVNVYTDLILNHNGFSDLGTFDDQGTPLDPNDDVTFAESGGYPGFVVTLSAADDPLGVGAIDGDFHSSFAGGDLEGRVSGLIDIDQSTDHQFIRQPVDPNNSDNIPAGTKGIFGRPPANVPNANNARFYPDQGLGGTVLDADPGTGVFNITRYDFNNAAPLAGDPILENAEQLTIRSVQWMVQAIGVDGFRIDAAKHFPQNTLTLLDQAVYAASFQTNHDGSIKPMFSFSEVLDGNKGFVQSFINKGLPNPHGIDPNDTTVRGNRDALDFPLSFALRDNLTENGLAVANNWHNIRGASQDSFDRPGGSEVWHTDGSSGVMFVDNHDDQNGIGAGDGTPFLDKVAYAYILMRPGNAVVYFNAEEFGTAEFRGFPTEGTDDALGGPVSGDAVATLVGIRNSHGRGNYHERWIDEAFGDGNGNGQQESNIYIYEREASAIVGLNSRNDAFVETRSGVQTAFTPGTVLVELTGNAADPNVDTGGVIPETVLVNGSGQIDISIPSNDTHGLGYVIYGLATPQGTLSLTNVEAVLAGGTPTPLTNGTTRQGDIKVIRADSFDVQLATSPVNLVDPGDPNALVRDVHADGDTALLRIDQGMDLNSISGIDNPTPGGIAYGFEDFTDTRAPGYVYDPNSGTNTGTGTGSYSQTIDATQLSEGRHYFTVRAFRHRNASTGGDGGPAVFADFKQAVYIDRLPPEAAVVSFEPFATDPGTLENRDLIVESVDKTADNMHIFLDLPKELTDAQIISLALGGQQDAGEYDVDSWIFGFTGVTTGNHVATVVTFEPSFDGTNGINVQRFAGLFTNTGVGAGFGDLDADNLIEVADLEGLANDSFEDLLYSQNAEFNAAADLDGDGDVDNLDLFALGPALVGAGASQAALDAYDDVLRRRGDVNQDGFTNGEDVAALHAAFGGSGWLEDLNADGSVDIDDVQTLVTDLARTVNGDFDLDRDVDGVDLLAWQLGAGTIAGGLYSQGDADLNGAIDQIDLSIWEAVYGTQGLGAQASAAAAVPEPHTMVLLVGGMTVFVAASRNSLIGAFPTFFSSEVTETS